MPRIYLCFLWHMHQPFYKDLLSGEYRLPWTRMHALKDYYGMVRVLKDFPQVRQTFNLVPSLVVQLEEYAAGRAADPFLRCALKPAESLSEGEQSFILRYFFQANPARLIYRYPRYAELYEAWCAADRKVARARRFFDARAMRDLQVLSQLSWVDEEFQDDPDVRALAEKQRDYSLGDQAAMGRIQARILGAVLQVYAEFAASGQIEISTTPFYHPILPLLCDTEIAGVSHPYVPLPGRFRYPRDARRQLESSRAFMRKKFGAAPEGLWPSEGSVSDEALALAAEAGFRWAATDNGVLSRTLGHAAGVAETYRPYVWRQGDREIKLLFRDHYLSDLIGFVYSRMGAGESAAHFLDRVRENTRGILAEGRDALVPVILDGENAWEHSELNGRPFLRELYRRISGDAQMEALTVAEALGRIESQPLGHVFPGSWINANFDVWIGAEEDNRAWEALLLARDTYERAIQAPGQTIAEENRQLAYEELLIAEGSDWCWWYGPEHDSENRPEFDKLFRDHLANVYQLLGLAPPEDLSRPILRVTVKEFHEQPTGPIRPVIDGQVTSYFEWLGAGSYRVDQRSGAMHGRRHLVRALHYGCDGASLFLRVDFEDEAVSTLAGISVRVRVEPAGGARPASDVTVNVHGRSANVAEARFGAPEHAGSAAEAAFEAVLEVRLSLAALGVTPNHSLGFQISLWRDGLPMDALPQQGLIKVSTTEPSDWPV
ncbi:MAG: glycoside hydrolase [Acidobacteria bacterium]|nr:glycoside hydrolase [Acidobacteriota bacterium]